MSTSSRRISEKMNGINRGGGRNKVPKSSTPGSAKGETCKADWRKKYYLSKDNKARKEKDYGSYHQMAIRLN